MSWYKMVGPGLEPGTPSTEKQADALFRTAALCALYSYAEYKTLCHWIQGNAYHAAHGTAAQNKIKQQSVQACPGRK